MAKILTRTEELGIVSSKRSSEYFTFSSQTQSDTTFLKDISKLPNCANPPCVRSHWGKLFSA